MLIYFLPFSFIVFVFLTSLFVWKLPIFPCLVPGFWANRLYFCFSLSISFFPLLMCGGCGALREGCRWGNLFPTMAGIMGWTRNMQATRRNPRYVNEKGLRRTQTILGIQCILQVSTFFVLLFYFSGPSFSCIRFACLPSFFVFIVYIIFTSWLGGKSIALKECNACSSPCIS